MIFVPFSDYSQSAAFFTVPALDSQLGKISSVLTVLMEGETITGANVYWDRYPYALAMYGRELGREFQLRSGSDHPAVEVCEDALCILGDTSRPWWLGVPYFHLSHQAIVSRKEMAVVKPSPTDWDYPVIQPVRRYGLNFFVIGVTP